VRAVRAGKRVNREVKCSSRTMRARRAYEQRGVPPDRHDPARGGFIFRRVIARGEQRAAVRTEQVPPGARQNAMPHALCAALHMREREAARCAR